MAETIKDFLVGIGYRVDGGSEQKFRNSVETATKGALALATAVAAASAAVTAAVTKIASSFDDLFYASQRTRASAENIKSIGYAVSQLGGSYQGAVASIEAFALKMRSNPGYESMARNLGVVTRENGKLKDTTALMTDIAKALSKKPEYVRLQYLEMLGMDEGTYKALVSGDLIRFQEEYRKKQEALGVTQSRAAEVGKELTQAWRSLGATAAAVGDKLLVSLGPGIKEFVDRIDAFLVRNADKIVEFFKKAGEWVAELLKAFIALVERGEGPLVEFFDKMVAGAQKMEKAFYAFAAFLGGAFLLSVLGSFSKVGAGFAGLLLKLGINPLTLGVGGALALSTGSANAGEDQEIARQRAAGTWGGNKFDGTNPAPKDTRNWWQRTMPKAIGGRDAPASVGNSTATIQPGSFSAKAPGIMKRLQEDFGFTKEQAAGILGNLGHESGGLKVMQEQNPQGGGRGGYGWAQWTGSRRRALEAWVAAKGLDIDSDEANYGFLKHELETNHKHAVAAVKAAKTAQEAMVAFENTYERAGVKAWGSRQKWTERALAAANAPQPADETQNAAEGDLAAEYKRKSGRDLAADQKNYPGHVGEWVKQFTGRDMPSGGGFDASRFDAVQDGRSLPAFDPSRLKRIQGNAAMGQGAFGIGGPVLVPPASNSTNVDMNQKTEITILGGGDPQATAREVASAQDKVNGGMLRNMAGAVR